MVGHHRAAIRADDAAHRRLALGKLQLLVHADRLPRLGDKGILLHRLFAQLDALRVLGVLRHISDHLLLPRADHTQLVADRSAQLHPAFAHRAAAAVGGIGRDKDDDLPHLAFEVHALTVGQLVVDAAQLQCRLSGTEHPAVVLAQIQHIDAAHSLQLQCPALCPGGFDAGIERALEDLDDVRTVIGQHDVRLQRHLHHRVIHRLVDADRVVHYVTFHIDNLSFLSSRIIPGAECVRRLWGLTCSVP